MELKSRLCRLFVAILLVAPSLAFTIHTQTSFSSTRTTGTSTSLCQSQQAEYGKSLELPGSYVKCGKCQTCYALKQEDLGERGRGRRLECSVCGHSWFQSKDRIMDVRDGFELTELPETDKERIELNIKEGKNPGFLGDIKLYVGNIAFECHEDDIVHLFSTIGNVSEVSLVRDENGRNRGFGFVTMRNKEDGERAMQELNGASIRGRSIAVRESTN